jgi:hypothetical protein
MAERTILVCDDCGKPATMSATIRINGRNLVKDLCDQDARALIRNARTPKRGRKAATVLAAGGAPERRGPGRPKGSTSKRSTSKRTGAKRATRRASSKRAGAKRTAAKRTAAKRTSSKRAGAKRTGRKRSGARTSATEAAA